jgi:hypothetical protein
VLTLLSGSENNSISNIKLTIPIDSALIFIEEAKVKELGLREKGLAQPHYSIQHNEGYDLLCYKDNNQDLHSSIIEVEKRVLFCNDEYLLYSGQTRTEKTIRNTMTWPGPTKDVEH